MSVGAVSQESPGPGRGAGVRLPSGAGLRRVRHGHPPCRSALLLALGGRLGSFCAHRDVLVGALLAAPWDILAFFCLKLLHLFDARFRFCSA